MQRSAAAQILGIKDAATRGEARAAYMALLQKASRELSPESTEFAARHEQLKDAYAAFSDADYAPSNPPTPTSISVSATDEPRFLGGSVRTWAVLLLVASLAIVFAVWTTLSNSGGSPTTNEQTSDTPSSSQTQQSTPRATPTPARTPDNGQSGLLNTCWRDEAPVLGGADNESTPVVQVGCSSPQAQWRVYKETRLVSECTDLYLTSTNGWTLCIRAM